MNNKRTCHKAEEALKNLRLDLKAANQRYHKIAVTAGRLRKTLEEVLQLAAGSGDDLKNGRIDADEYHENNENAVVLIHTKVRGALKRNDGLAVKYEDALKAARDALEKAEWGGDVRFRICPVCRTAGEHHREVCELNQAITHINSILGEKE